MVHSFDGYNYVIRLDKGERLQECMSQFLRHYSDIGGAWVSGIGGALEVELGFYDLDKREYQWQVLEQPLEIISLQGTIALNEQQIPTAHFHGAFADRDYHVMAGHVKDLVVGGTCELFIHRSYKPLHRKYDESIGLNTLDL